MLCSLCEVERLFFFTKSARVVSLHISYILDREWLMPRIVLFFSPSSHLAPIVPTCRTKSFIYFQSHDLNHLNQRDSSVCEPTFPGVLQNKRQSAEQRSCSLFIFVSLTTFVSDCLDFSSIHMVWISSGVSLFKYLSDLL